MFRIPAMFRWYRSSVCPLLAVVGVLLLTMGRLSAERETSLWAETVPQTTAKPNAGAATKTDSTSARTDAKANKSSTAGVWPDSVLTMLQSDSYHQRQNAWLTVREQLEKSGNPLEQLKTLRQYLNQNGMDFEALYQLNQLESHFAEKAAPTNTTGPQTNTADSQANTTDPQTNAGNGAKSTAKPTATLNPQVADALLNQLAADSYVDRVQAEAAIQEQAHTGLVAPWLQCLRRRLTEQELGLDDTLRLLRLEESLRTTWLMSLKKSEKVTLEYTTEEMASWMKTLAETTLDPVLLDTMAGLEQKIKQPWMIDPGESPWGKIEFLSSAAEKQGSQAQLRQCWLAVRSLEDALAADWHTNEIVSWLVNERSKTHSKSAQILFQHFAILFRPCVASEYWLNGKQLSSQVVIIGVPQRDPGNPEDHATAFDKLTETTVKCVDGYNLTRGVHPLEQAIRHPKNADAAFYIVSIATPLQKLQYPHRTLEPQRAERVVENTLKPCMESQTLTEDQYFLLERMEPHRTSMFVARMLNEFPNAYSFVPSHGNTLQNQRLVANSGSLYELLCQYLIKCGTKEAVPGFLQAVKSGRLNSIQGPYAWEEMVLLSIANRDPWDGAEAWLKERVDSARFLVKIPNGNENSPMQTSQSANGNQLQVVVKVSVSQENAPQLGASAAAILGKMMGDQPALIGLAPAGVGMPHCRFNGWRFRNEEAQTEIREALGL